RAGTARCFHGTAPRGQGVDSLVMRGNTKATEERLLKVLTDEQKTKWQELLGEPFKGELKRGFFSAEKGPRTPLAQARFHYPSLEAMAREFLAHVSLPVNQACFGVAGPVVGGRARLTNLPWLVEETALHEALKLQAARLPNDSQRP